MNIFYSSTRRSDKKVTASQAILQGLAEDGGLFVPNQIPAFENRLIPTGIASALAEDCAFIFRERGSTGVKNMKVSAGVIDSGFNGEWFVCIYNGNKVPLFISKIGETGEQSPLTEHPEAILYPYNKAIAQALLVPVPSVLVEEVSYEEIQNRPTERGCNQLGSTNVE